MMPTTKPTFFQKLIFSKLNVFKAVILQTIYSKTDIHQAKYKPAIWARAILSLQHPPNNANPLANLSPKAEILQTKCFLKLIFSILAI
jgi:hypothetical protein